MTNYYQTISTAIPAGYALNAKYDFLSVTSTGSVGGTGLLLTAQAAVTNHGALDALATSDGVDFEGTGSLLNGAGATVYGLIGVASASGGETGAVTNLGVIGGVSLGVELYGDSLANGSFTTRAALVTGATGVTAIGETSSIANFGTILGTGGANTYGVDLGDGSLANGAAADTTALVSGYQAGVNAGAYAAVANFGTIQATGEYGAGVLQDISGGGTLRVVNGSLGGHAALIAGTNGVSILEPGTVINFGAILCLAGGSSYYAVRLIDGGQVTNGAPSDPGALLAGYNGVFLGVSGAVANFGAIEADNFAVRFTGVGALTNGSAGDQKALIEGYKGVAGDGPAITVTNFGTITSSAAAGYGAVFNGGAGMVANGSAIDRNALLSGAYGVRFEGVGTVANYATIVGEAAYGVAEAGGHVTNGEGASSSALIEGVGGVGLTESGAVANLGVINGTTGAGISLAAGGLVTNGGAGNHTAVIEGATGVATPIGIAAAVTVGNFGTILGGVQAGNYAVALEGGGALANGSVGNSHALVEGYSGVLAVGAAVTNFGTITGAGDAGGAGVYLQAGASLTNGASGHAAGVIEGFVGVATGPSFAGTVVNYATLIGQGGTAVRFANPATLKVEPGSAFVGAVFGDGGSLVLASGTGTLANLGFSGVTVYGSMARAAFTDFDVVQIDAPASFTLEGAGEVIPAATLTVLGTVTTATTLSVAGSLTTRGTLAGTGRLNITGGITEFQIGTHLAIASVSQLGGKAYVDDAVLVYAGPWDQSAGTLSVAVHDRIELGGANTFAGTLAGAGFVDITAGTTEFSKATLTVAAIGEGPGGAVINVSGAKTVYAGLFTQDAGTLSVASDSQLDFTGVGNTFEGVLAEGSGKAAGTVAFTAGTDSLVGATVEGTVSAAGAQVGLTGVITFADGQIAQSAGEIVVAAAGATLTGLGAIVMSGASEIVGQTAASTLTLDSDVEGSGNLGGGQMTLAVGITGGIISSGGAALTVDTGANTLVNAGSLQSEGTGGLVIDGALDNTGSIEAENSNLTVNGAVGGAGQYFVDKGTLTFASTFNQNVSFLGGATGVLELADSLGYTATISGVSDSTALELDDVTFVSGQTTATYAGSATAGVLVVGNGTVSASLNITGAALPTGPWTVSQDSAGGTEVVEPGALAPHAFIQAAAALAPRAPAPATQSPDPWRRSSPLLATPRTQVA